jgi:hypothetical protein
MFVAPRRTMLATVTSHVWPGFEQLMSMQEDSFQSRQGLNSTPIV